MNAKILIMCFPLIIATVAPTGKTTPENDSVCCPPGETVEAEASDESCSDTTCDAGSDTHLSTSGGIIQTELHIEFLYLDVSTCGRCQGSDSGLDAAVAEAGPLLTSMGIGLTVNKIHVQSEGQARELRFRSSPTIRINGVDIAPDIRESLCGDCGDICGDSVDCREWEYNGQTYAIPPKAMILDAIFRSIYAVPPADERPYDDVPENLKRFFEGSD
ncbi:MAG: DUF2703 domain-containing protein [bacterium]|nr:DUF2703 domain-containing protein [bacterium]